MGAGTGKARRTSGRNKSTAAPASSGDAIHDFVDATRALLEKFDAGKREAVSAGNVHAFGDAAAEEERLEERLERTWTVASSSLSGNNVDLFEIELYRRVSSFLLTKTELRARLERINNEDDSEATGTATWEDADVLELLTNRYRIAMKYMREAYKKFRKEEKSALIRSELRQVKKVTF